jgi:DNA-binding winged helix-turn-helix (wHTH) protein/TolB-like protein
VVFEVTRKNRNFSEIDIHMFHGGNRIYRFGTVRIDPAGRYLTRDGEEQHLRERSFEVLIYLLENRHRLVKKEELIEHIWKVDAVTDDVLVQSIGEIRKAVGDDRRNPQFVKTIPKSGYRLIAAVEEVLEQQQDPVEMEEISSVTIEIEEDNTPLPVEPAMAIPAVRRRWLPLSLSVLAICCCALIVWYYFAAREKVMETSFVKVPGKKLIAVMFFDNQSGETQLDWLREGLPDMLVTGLSRSNRVTLLSPQQLYPILKRFGHKDSRRMRMDEALQVAHKISADSLVLGGFAKIGNQIRVDAQLYNTRSSELIGAEQLIVNKP